MEHRTQKWVVVSGGIHQRGGQDKANAALARYLIHRGDSVTLVSHCVDDEFRAFSNCRIVTPKRILDSDFLSQFTLGRVGRRVAREMTNADRSTRVIVNGGIFPWPDVNWMHCVHHAWAVQSPCHHQSLKQRLQHAVFRGSAKNGELAAVRAARLVIANSSRTKADIESYLGKDPGQVHVVNLGADPTLYPPSEQERRAARERYGLPANRLAVAFIGGLDRDDHKGFSRIFSAWTKLCHQPDWPGDLLVAGDGNQLEFWRARTRHEGMDGRIRFLGFVEEVPTLLAAADLLVSPVRYEAYGLNVQEAICRGVPALVSGVAGVASQYPSELKAFLLPQGEDVDELADRILQWRANVPFWRERFARFSVSLAHHTWETMAAAMVEVIEDHPSAEVNELSGSW